MSKPRFSMDLDLYAYFCYALGAFQLGGLFPFAVVRPFVNAFPGFEALFYATPLLEVPGAFEVYLPGVAFDAARIGMAAIYLGIGYGVRHRRSPRAWRLGQGVLASNLLAIPLQRALWGISITRLDWLSASYVCLMAFGIYLARQGRRHVARIEREREDGP